MTLIKEVFTGVQCDSCKEVYGDEHEGYSFWNDENQARERATENDWFNHNDLDYCPKCFTRDEDFIVINKTGERIDE